jgi:two-component system NtrC family response regulator
MDDEGHTLKEMRNALEPEYEVCTTTNESEALTFFRQEKPPVVALSLSVKPRSPSELDGIGLVEEILSLEPSTRVIVVTDSNEDNTTLRAVRLGAFDCYSKPVRLNEIMITIQRALHMHRLQEHLLNQYVSEAGFESIISASKSMRDCLSAIERVALSNVPVLICGESGTGKELVAHAIHQQSRRKANPFVVVNCGAIPEYLLESELFGHEIGAFAGAHAQKRGKFELAHTGTLFLDEIGEFAPGLQAKLLRFLQGRRIDRVGGTQPIEIDVRLIVATNRNLKEEMEKGAFRKDLYYRLNVLSVNLPPLRERKQDIIPLAQYFLAKFCLEHRKAPMTLSPQAEGVLLRHTWPGNVRELENLIRRAVVLSSRAVLKATDLGLTINESASDVNLKFAKRAIEMDFVRKALSRNNGIVSRAARELGISRVNLYELIGKYNIPVQEFKINRKPNKDSGGVPIWKV